MEWIVIGVSIGIALWTYFRMPRMPQVSTKPSEIQIPICEDGAHVPVVFGTVPIKDFNVAWWGDPRAEEMVIPKGAIRYGFSMFMDLCHGPIDGFLRVFVGGKSPYFEPIMVDKEIFMDAGYLHGGGTGYDGPMGYIYFRRGHENVALGNTPGFTSNMSTLNGCALGPGFFGIATVEFRKMYIGFSPYPEPWVFVVQRILKRHDLLLSGTSDQWYLAKAAITHGVCGETRWWRVQGGSHAVPSGDMNAWLVSNYPDDVDFMDHGAYLMPFGHGQGAPAGLPDVGGGQEVDAGWDSNSHLWCRATIFTDPSDVRYAGKIYFFVYCENSAFLWIDGQYVGSTNPTNAAVNGSSANFDVTEKLGKPGPHQIVLYCLDENPADTDPGITYVYARVVTSPIENNSVDAATLYSHKDMNPAHIIRECLTDPVWGLGVNDADVDNVSFMEAADILYAEKFGLSFEWNKSGSIEDFIDEVKRHINATVFVNRQTGKYQIKLIREGYDPSGVLSLGEDDIEKIEDVSRRTAGDLVNQVVVTYTASAMGDDGTVMITDPGLVQQQGAVIPTKIDYPGITTHELASRVALRDLKVHASPSISCTITASRKAASLNLGDPFFLTWPDYGLSQTPMRVMGIKLGDGRNNRVQITAIEDVFASPDYVVNPPGPDTWQTPDPPLVAVADPIFVDNYQYKSRFLVASLTDRTVRQTVDCVFCLIVGASGPGLPVLFNQRFPNAWEEIRAGVWRARTAGEAVPESYLRGLAPFAGMRVLAAFIEQAENPGADLEDEDKPRQGIYVFTDPGFSWDKATHTYTSTFAQLERATDFLSGDQIADGCVVRIDKGPYAGKWARLTTSGEIEIGVTPQAWEKLDTFSPVRGDALLTEEQAAAMGDGVGNSFNISATASSPSGFLAYPTLQGTPNVQTMPAGRTRWKLWASLDVEGDPGSTTTITCQLVKFVDIDHVTVLAEAETDPIKPGDGLSPHIWWDEYTTHADVDVDQVLSGGRIATRYEVRTTSTSQVVVAFRWGDMSYGTRVDTPIVLGATDDFHTPYGDTVPIGPGGILVVPDANKRSGTVRVSGSELRGVDTRGWVGGDPIKIRFTEACVIYQNQTVASPALPLNLSTAGGLSGDDLNTPVGPRSSVALQLDDLEGYWEASSPPVIM